ncbi:hypothetical protein Pelo_14676 [Pelomyxa schiedti]|nr:hypothetical protein Pelo_14676 [Pelomyxa schiedti]
MRSWVQGIGEKIVGANQHYLVVVNEPEEGGGCYLQDTVTGERASLMIGQRRRFRGEYYTNGKWVACLASSELHVVPLPLKRALNDRGQVVLTEPIVLPLPVVDYPWRDLHWDTSCQDHLLLCFLGASGNFNYVLVDIEKTFSTKSLAVLSETTHKFDLLIYPFQSWCVMTKQGGAHSFAMVERNTNKSASLVIVDEGTGRMQQTPDIPGSRLPRFVSPLDPSLLCVFGLHKDRYDVWDINDTSKPIREMSCLQGCTTNNAFVEGGLLFQMSESRRELHVTEESSGYHVITLQFFSTENSRHLFSLDPHYSFLLSELGAMHGKPQHDRNFKGVSGLCSHILTEFVNCEAKRVDDVGCSVW